MNRNEEEQGIVLVTGAAAGIGLATEEAFAQAGWRVIGVDRMEPTSMPRAMNFWKVDVSDPTQTHLLAERFSGEIGRLDALVNNAAIQLAKPILETDLEEWDAVQSVNLRAVFHLSKLMQPLLTASQGAIVNVSSVHALSTSQNIAAYAASKAGVLSLTRSMALEFGPDGVRVNAVLPGAVDTRMLREGLSRGHLDAESIDQQIAALGTRVALGRIGRSGEIAQAILFLADRNRSSYITGAGLVVDGGALARLSTE